MKKILPYLGAVVLFIVVFWLGIMYAFPGAAVSDYVAARLRSETGHGVWMQPAALRWNGLHISQVRFDAGDSGAPGDMIVVHDLEVPFGTRLIWGVPVRGMLGGNGSVAMFMPWGNGQMSFSVKGLELASLGQIKSLTGLPVTGRLDVSGYVDVRGGQLGAARGQFPAGAVSGEVTALSVDGLSVFAKKLPAVRLDFIRFDVALGPLVEIRSVTFDGDIRGNIGGQIQPNLRRLAQSRMQLALTAAFRSSWLNGLGEFRPLAEGYLDNGQLRARVDGTLEHPQFVPAGKGSS